MKNEDNLQKRKDNKKQSRGKYIIAVCILFLFIMPVVGVLRWKTKPDFASEKMIRNYAAKALTKDPNNPRDPNKLTNEDLENIVSFELGGSPLSASSVRYFVALADIKYLEKFKNLQELSLNCIIYPQKNIPKWMIAMAQLGLLEIDKKFALDLSPLEKLHNLKKLTINATAIKNIEPLSGLKNLERLNVSGTNVSDLKPIVNLNCLEYLNVSDTHIDNLKPVSELSNLRELYARYTQISDLKPLMKLKNLQYLNISGCKNISDEQVEDLRIALPGLYIEYGK